MQITLGPQYNVGEKPTVILYICCFSHSALWLPTRKKLLYTVANPARGLLNREKKEKEKVWQRPPPPPSALLVRRKKKKKKKKSRDASTSTMVINITCLKYQEVVLYLQPLNTLACQIRK